jgi:arylsulfatase A-like enzyme
VEAPTENVDLWPTLLDLLGLPAIEDADGHSRLPEILAAARGEPAPSRDRPRFAHLDQTWGRPQKAPLPMVAVSEGSYRLVRRATAENGELYDRSSDPQEQRDIGEEQPEVRERLMALVEEYLERPPAPWQAAPEVELGPAELDQLRALGYVLEE